MLSPSSTYPGHMTPSATHAIDSFEAAVKRLEPLDAETFERLRSKQNGGLAPATVAGWLEALAALHQWTASEAEFFSAAARFIVDPVGLDGAMVVKRTLRAGQPDWQIVASHLPRPDLDAGFQPALVERAIEAEMTLFHPLAMSGSAVVVTPLVDATGEAWGAIYAFRVQHAGNGRRGIRYLEAHLVEVLAKSVSTGIARLDNEANAVRELVVFEQTFTPEIAAQMQRNRNALAGVEREVTVLFTDLREFSKLCEQLDAKETYGLLNELMETLTAAVMEFDGTLIDYYGDGLSAMWNAPIDQTNHAYLACCAGKQMVEQLPAISRRWQTTLPSPLRLGVGIHSGPAQVGNIGSSQRMKYGPRGTTVNLASRLESATKQIGTPMLISSAVAEQVDANLPTYRVCRANLPGAAMPTELYSLKPQPCGDAALAGINRYEQALACFEAGKYEKAYELVQQSVGDSNIPSDFLAQAVQDERARQQGRRTTDKRRQASGKAIDLRTN